MTQTVEYKIEYISEHIKDITDLQIDFVYEVIRTKSITVLSQLTEILKANTVGSN